MMTHKQSEYRLLYRLATLPLALLGCYVLVFLLDPSRQWDKFFDRDSSVVVREIFFSSIVCALLLIFNTLSSKILDRLLAWERFPVSRFFTQFIIQVVSAIFIFITFLYLTLYFTGNESRFRDLSPSMIRQAFVINVILSVMISFISTGTFFFRQWRGASSIANELELKAANLRRIALEAELHSIKMQLDPHFMFNNFSTLSALIAQDEKLAQLFLENLSKVYRYMIANIPRNVVSLKEELAFANAYFYLMKIRLGDNVRLIIDLDEEILGKGIPPITLQLLIENALKHNVASRHKPIVITVLDGQAGDLLVTNTLQRLTYQIPSTKMGLVNIESRYMLLTGKKPEIIETVSEFRVRLPLIDIADS